LIRDPAELLPAGRSRLLKLVVAFFDQNVIAADHLHRSCIARFALAAGEFRVIPAVLSAQNQPAWGRQPR